MKVIFHKKYTEMYLYGLAAEAGRVEAICRTFEGVFEFGGPIPAVDGDLQFCHTEPHSQHVRKGNPSAYALGKQAVDGPLKRRCPPMKRIWPDLTCLLARRGGLAEMNCSKVLWERSKSISETICKVHT